MDIEEAIAALTQAANESSLGVKTPIGLIDERISSFVMIELSDKHLPGREHVTFDFSQE